jgi:hypothetical protein
MAGSVNRITRNEGIQGNNMWGLKMHLHLDVRLAPSFGIDM